MVFPNDVGVLIDLDGLLVDSERSAAAAWLEARDELGLSIIPTDTFHAMTGLTVAAADRLAFELLGDGEAVQLLRKRRDHIFAEKVEVGGIAPMSGAVELLTYLCGKRIPHALVTSSSREEALSKLSSAGLGAFTFQATVFGPDCDHSKPHPEPYLRVIAEMRNMASTFVALEDSTNGLRSASAAHATAVHIFADQHSRENCAAAGATRCLPSLREVLSLFE